MRHGMLTVVIIAVAAIDMIVVLLVLRNARARLAAFGATFAERKEMLTAAKTLMSSFLESSYSGDPETLPAVVANLAPQLEQLMRSRGLEPTPTALETLLRGGLASRRVPPGAMRRAIASLP